MKNNLTFNTFSKKCKERTELFHKNGLYDWTLTDWTTALAGEVGEICDAAKKIRRYEIGSKQSKNVPYEKLIQNIKDEIGDAQAYLCLLAEFLNVDIVDCVVDKFNAVSKKESVDIFVEKEEEKNHKSLQIIEKEIS